MTETTELEKLRKENAFLKQKLRVRIDLIDGDVPLGYLPEKMPQKDIADIASLTKYPQWKAFRRWMLINANLFFQMCDGASDRDCFVLTRLMRMSINIVQDAERITPEDDKQSPQDTYDETSMGQILNEPGNQGKELPLPEEDE